MGTGNRGAVVCDARRERGFGHVQDVRLRRQEVTPPLKGGTDGAGAAPHPAPYRSQVMGAFQARRIARAVLRRFDPQARPMPWRDTRDPYRIWISEVMLQQTTVTAATPYYERFIAAFPAVTVLADAPLDRVLKLWEGLGYYARARNLHRAARMIVRERGGRLPETVEELMALPGIGRSTAGAIAAIAFGADAPVLDANVRRVAARLLGLEGDLNRAPARRALWEFAERLVIPGRGRETALAFMDLGALVCTPRRPACAACPARSYCAAYRRGDPEAIPTGRARRRRPVVKVVVALIEDGLGRFLVGRRPDGALLGGLWAFPGGRMQAGETPAEAARRIAREKAGIFVEAVGAGCALDHVYSHYAVTLHGQRCRRQRGRLRPACGFRWADPREIGTIPFAVSNRRLADLLIPGG